MPELTVNKKIENKSTAAKNDKERTSETDLARVINNNVRRMLILLSRDKSEDLKPTREKFKKIYEKLPDVGQKIAESYHDMLHKVGLNPGEIRVYIVGGRVKGKPLKADSDIDIIITVGNVSQSPEAGLKSFASNFKMDIEDALYFRDSLKEKLVGNPITKEPGIMSAICKDLNISNEFHILNFGSQLPTQLNKPGDYLLIGIKK